MKWCPLAEYEERRVLWYGHFVVLADVLVASVARRSVVLCHAKGLVVMTLTSSAQDLVSSSQKGSLNSGNCTIEERPSC